VTAERTSMGKTLSFMQRLWGLAHALQAKSKRMESELGITGPQRLAIRLIGRSPGITPGALATTLRMHPSTLTGILRRLEERGVVAREEDRDDGRRMRLRLRAAGRRLDQKRGGTVEAAVKRALAQLDPEHVRITQNVLTKLTEELERE
jgi:DNA-binding MarR family transcriptional regulator